MLELIRDKTKVTIPFTRDVYTQLMNSCYHGDFPACSNNAGWTYEFVSRKMYMVVHGYSGIDPTRNIQECNNKCGFDAYRLLVKEYDPVSSDTGYH